MLFNSLEFFYFFVLILFLFWSSQKILKNSSIQVFCQNSILLLGSFIFYSFWNFKFLSLLIFIILIGYYSGIMIDKYKRNETIKKKIYLSSVIIHISILFTFKYFNFFQAEITQLFNLKYTSYYKLLLPVGISFYIFHGISYVTDIRYNRIGLCKNVVNYGLFISYFPLLISGPIERATTLLPQLKKVKKISKENVKIAAALIFFGLFKKVVIADNLAHYVDIVFDNGGYLNKSSLEIILSIVCFSIQIYCDFSGYTDIAIGISQMFGIELIQNFDFPYFSRNIKEFWSKWHISLTSFFRDYLYIPLGGSKKGFKKQVWNVLIVFTISGFWHGANWTFLIWGLIHFIFYLPHLLPIAQRLSKNFLNTPTLVKYFTTFLMVSFGWVFFRSMTFTEAINLLESIPSNFHIAQTEKLYLPIFLLIVWLFFEYKIKKDNDFIWNNILVIIVMTIFLRVVSTNSFIYFQF